MAKPKSTNESQSAPAKKDNTVTELQNLANYSDATMAAIFIACAAIQYPEAFRDFYENMDNEAIQHLDSQFVRDAIAFFSNTAISAYVAKLNLPVIYNWLTRQPSNEANNEPTTLGLIMGAAALLQCYGTTRVMMDQLTTDTPLESNMDMIALICNFGMTVSLAIPSLLKAANATTHYFSPGSTVSTLWNKSIGKVADCMNHTKDIVSHYVPGMRAGGV